MKRPEIYTLIDSINNKRIKLSAFITLGSAALIAVNPLFSALAITAAIPLILLLKIKHHLKNASSTYCAIESKVYRTDFIKWFDNYLSNDNDIKEKKYNLSFMALWLNNKNFNDILPLFNERLNSITYQLMNKNLIDENLHSIFQRNYGEPLPIYEVLKKDTQTDLKGIQKAYLQYSNEGLLGTRFKKGFDKDFYLLALLQDYKLSFEDVKQINNNDEINLCSVDSAILNHCEFEKEANFYKTKGHYIVHKIVENNDDILVLESLKSFYSKPSLDKKYHSERLDDLNDFIKIIDKKLNYFILDAKIANKNTLEKSVNLTTKKNNKL
jgi:hypothetical protein